MIDADCWSTAMRIVLIIAGISLLGLSVGCSSPSNGTEAFYERHPQYDNRPSYFDKRMDYDDEDLNEKYSGDKN
jgi:hypothetical protein